MFILQLHPESQIQAKHLQSCTCSFFFLQRALQNLENSSQPNVQKPTSSFPGGRPSNPNEIDRERASEEQKETICPPTSGLAAGSTTEFDLLIIKVMKN